MQNLTVNFVRDLRKLHPNHTVVYARPIAKVTNIIISRLVSAR